MDRTHKTVRLYPNPTSDGMFIIACNNNTIPYNLKILNSTGNIIFSQEKIKTRKKQLSIASFPTGVYLVHISSGKFIKTSKIIYQYQNSYEHINQLNLNITPWAKGLYIVKIINDNEIFTQKILYQ